MEKSKKLLGPSKIRKGIFIDTNIILGVGGTIAFLYRKNKYQKLNKIISDTLNKHKGIIYNLSQRYTLVTPISSQYEFINKLRKKYNTPPFDSKRIFDEIISKFGITPVTFNEEKNFLTYAFFERIIECELDLIDGIQLFIAFKKKMPFVTGDEKHIEKMRKFYSDVFTYPEMIKKYEKG